MRAELRDRFGPMPPVVEGLLYQIDVKLLAQQLSDAELLHVLGNACALVFPSLYEGFGLPLVEAQAVGCPVIASHRGSIPEVGGDSALYFDALDPASAVELVTGLDDVERARLIGLGRRNVERYTWDASAQLVLEIVRSPR